MRKDITRCLKGNVSKNRRLKKNQRFSFGSRVEKSVSTGGSKGEGYFRRKKKPELLHRDGFFLQLWGRRRSFFYYLVSWGEVSNN